MTKVENAPFTKIASDIAKASITRASTKLAANFEARMAFETTNSPANKTIQTKLVSYGKKFAMPAVVRSLLAANVELNFMNTSVGAEVKKFNVYSVDKVADLAQALDSGAVKNAINLATLKNLFAADALGHDFTGDHARGSVSDGVALPSGHKKWMTHHTAAPSTAPTQASSTMNALNVMGVVKNTGTTKAPIWKLQDVPQTKRFKEMVTAKAA